MDENPHMLALGWTLGCLDGDPERVQLVDAENAHQVAQAFCEILISNLLRTGQNPREVLLRQQQQHLQMLIDHEDRQRRLYGRANE